MALVVLLRKSNIFYRCFSIHTLLLIVVLCILKAFVVIEFPFTFNINLTKIITTIQAIFEYTVFSLNIKNFIFDICVGHIFIAISLLGSVIFIYKTSYDCIKFYKFVNTLPRTKNNDIHRILSDVQELTNSNEKIEIVIHKKIGSPAIMGYFNPIIVLPDLDFTYEELKGIFVHEIMHYKYKHMFLRIIIKIIRILFWWNPLVYFFNYEANNILEFHADKKLSELLNKQEQISYLESIIKVINNCEQQKKSPLIITKLIEYNNEKIIEQRFVVFLKGMYSKEAPLKSKMIFLTALLLFVTSYMFVIQPYNKPTEEDYGDSAPIIKDDFYIIKNRDNYTIYDAAGNHIATYTGDIDEKFNYLKIKENR